MKKYRKPYFMQRRKDPATGVAQLFVGGVWLSTSRFCTGEGEPQGSLEIELQPNAWTTPEGNTREHWFRVWERGRAQRAIVGMQLLKIPSPRTPVKVRITRMSVGELDTDGLTSALKRVRDVVADWVGCGDSNRDPIHFVCDQQPAEQGRQFVRIEWRTVTPDELQKAREVTL